jgi:hypothetical protein
MDLKHAVGSRSGAARRDRAKCCRSAITTMHCQCLRMSRAAEKRQCLKLKKCRELTLKKNSLG